MHLNQLSRPRGLPHQQQYPVRAPIERKHLPLPCGSGLRLTRLDEIIFAGMTILNPGFLPTIEHRCQASLFMNQFSRSNTILHNEVFSPYIR